MTLNNNGYPIMGVFTTDEPVTLEMMPNGGWVVTQRSPDRGVMPNNLGAYSSAEDMLEALKAALIIGSEGQ